MASPRTDRLQVAYARPMWLRLAPVVFVLLWSAGFPFVAIGLEHSEPITFLSLRFAVVLALLLPLLLIVRPPPPRTLRDCGHLAVVGFLVQALYFGLAYVAMGLEVPVGTVALIVSLQPVLVALLAPRLAGESVSALRWAGLGLGLLGAGIVIGVRSEVETTSALGFICAAGALAGITLGTLYEKRFGVGHHPVTANLLQYGVGLAATLPLAWALEDMRIAWTGELLVSLGYLVVANSLISITLLLAMIRHGEAARVSALFFLVPPLAALIAWVLVGEAMPAPAWAGMALAGIGVALATWSDPRGRRSPP